MAILERLKAMFGRKVAVSCDPCSNSSRVSPDISRAVQRNEQASARAQQALESLRMADTLRDIAGKM